MPKPPLSLTASSVAAKLITEKAHSFMSGGGEMGKLMCSQDWSTSAVGPIETWPQSLRTAISIILNSSIPMFIWWGDDLTNFYNDAYSQILGEKHPDSLGKPGRETWNEIWSDVSPLAKSVLSTGEPIYRENLPLTINRRGYSEQAYFTFSYGPIRNESGKIGGIHCACIETTSQIKAQNLLKASQDRYKAFIANSSEGIWCIELSQPVPITLSSKKQIDQFYAHGFLAECNDTMAKMYGLKTASDLIGAKLGDLLLRNDPGNIEYLTAFIQSGYRLTGVESHEKDSNGMDKYFSNSLVGIVEDGHLIRAWGVQQDVTNRKTVERLKDEFIGIASHELKTPVTSLKAYTQSLHKKLIQQNNHEIATPISKMERQLDKLTNLISDLLDVTQIESGKLQLKPSQFDLNQLLNDVVEEVQQTTQHHIEFKLDTSASITADRDRIGQVITNLLANAIKFSPHLKKIEIGSKLSKRDVQVSVKDYGMGIPTHNQEHIFDRFYRVENDANHNTYAGLGLGLYISAEIIKRHHGKIWLESQPGQGTTFYFSLPLK